MAHHFEGVIGNLRRDNENWNTLYLGLEGRAGRSAHRRRWGKASMHEVNG